MHSVNIQCKRWNVSLRIALQTLNFSLFFLWNYFIHFWLCDRRLIRSTKLKFQTLYIIKGLSGASQPQLLHLKKFGTLHYGIPSSFPMSLREVDNQLIELTWAFGNKRRPICSKGFGISATGVLFGLWYFLFLIWIPCFQSCESDDRHNPEGQQEVKSSYCRQGGKSVLC